MSLLGNAALAMWWDMAADVKAEFEDWHSHEHFPERMAIPGFRRGTRWTSATGGEGIFVIYEMESHDTLSSAAYVAHLNAPTPWSTRMMPHHRNMVRSQCLVQESRGGAVARHALTVRFSTVPGREADARSHFKSLGEALVPRPGVVGAHLLRHQAPRIAQTTEQKIRSGDQAADWAFIACGYDLAALQDVACATLADPELQSTIAGDPLCGFYSLSHSATTGDFARG